MTGQLEEPGQEPPILQEGLQQDNVKQCMGACRAMGRQHEQAGWACLTYQLVSRGSQLVQQGLAGGRLDDIQEAPEVAGVLQASRLQEVGDSLRTNSHGTITWHTHMVECCTYSAAWLHLLAAVLCCR